MKEQILQLNTMTKEKQLIVKIRNLYTSYKLEECIQEISKQTQQEDFEYDQHLQLYKGLSLLELGFFKDGLSHLESQFQQAQEKKGQKVETIDLITRIFYQIQVYYIDEYKADCKNQQLKDVCELYKKQNENSDLYRNSFYMFGIGVYQFIKDHYFSKQIECLQILEQALEQEEEYKQDIMIFLGWAYHIMEKTQKAEIITKELYDINPYYPSVTNNLGIYSRALKKNELAQKYYEEAEKLCPQNSCILENIGYFYQYTNDKQNALIYYEKAYNIKPRTARSCLCLGKILCQKDLDEEGIEKFKEGIEIDPEYPDNYENIALQIASKDQEEATRLIQKCISLRPNEGYYYLCLGNIQMMNEELESALEYLNKSLTFQNRNYFYREVYFCISICYFYLEECEEALKNIFLAENECVKSNQQHFDFAVQIIESDQISYKQIIKQVTNIYGPIQDTFFKYTTDLSDKNLINLFLYRLEVYRVTLQILAQQNNIQQYLIYRSHLSHQDLYIN
ncbi:hypothetical protein ABPG72_005398 [Tetrahymena utriculariae]